MSDFEYLFALFGLLFGLIVAELALRFADAIDSHRVRPMGILTPALAFLVLTDMTSYWLFLWAFRASLHVSFTTVFSGVLLAMPCLATALSVSVKWVVDPQLRQKCSSAAGSSLSSRR